MSAIDLVVTWPGYAIGALLSLDDWQELAGVLVVVLLIGQWRWGLRMLCRPAGASDYFDELAGRTPRALPRVSTPKR